MDNLTLSDIVFDCGQTAPPVSFGLPEGGSLAVIGDDDSLKSCFMKTISGISRPAGGSLAVAGEPVSAAKQAAGYVYDGWPLSLSLTLGDIDNIMKGIYARWSTDRFYGFCFEFGLQKKKAIKELPVHMLRKLLLCIAMSHSTRLLILNDPFSDADGGLDEDIVRVLRGFLKKNPKRSLVISARQESAAAGLADHFLFLFKNSGAVFISKEEFAGDYVFSRCGVSDFARLDKNSVLFFNDNKEEVQFIIKKSAAPKNIKCSVPSAADAAALMKGEKV